VLILTSYPTNCERPFDVTGRPKKIVPFRVSVDVTRPRRPPPQRATISRATERAAGAALENGRERDTLYREVVRQEGSWRAGRAIGREAVSLPA
jgi:hypothetical protein